MDERIKKSLNQEQPTDFHKEILQHCRDLVELSRDHMSTFYDTWDANTDVYEGRRQADESDRKAEKRGEPIKMVVPLTYAQIQTFIAFCFATFFQRERMFELVGMGSEDAKPAKVGEALLERDLAYNVHHLRVYQFLLDAGKYGLGVLKTGWCVEKQLTKETIESKKHFLGLSFGTKTQTVENWLTKYEGNKIFNISPYRFFPDPRLPFSRLQEGEFCASEDSISYIELRRLENDGAVAGVDWVKQMTEDAFEESGRRMTHTTLYNGREDSAPTLSDSSSGSHVLTEVQVKIVPNDFELEDGKPLGPEKYPVIYNIWIVNDQRVVKCEPLGYVHGLFTYDVGEINPDMHNLVNEGLAGIIDQLQNVITWLINSHITSVRKNIDNKLIVDPAGVEMSDLKERRPVIRLKQEASRTGVDRWIKQLAVSDVTQNHITDANALQAIVQIVTGINDNALGQFHTGRRSATEARSVNSATAARLKMVATLLWKGALEPMGRKMLSNLRDGLSVEAYIKILGEESDPNTYVQFAKVTKDDLIGDYDFEVFDGTIPSERYAQAETLQELLLGVLSSPDALALLGYDPRKLADEVLELKGIRNPRRFKLDEVRMAEMQQQQQMLLTNGQQQQPTTNGTGAPGGPVQPALFGGRPQGVPLVNGAGAAPGGPSY
jgi:hypothetical protein